MLPGGVVGTGVERGHQRRGIGGGDGVDVAHVGTCDDAEGRALLPREGVDGLGVWDHNEAGREVADDGITGILEPGMRWRARQGVVIGCDERYRCQKGRAGINIPTIDHVSDTHRQGGMLEGGD